MDALQKSLNHLIRHKNFEQRVERVCKRRDHEKRLLMEKQEELLDLIHMLKLNLDMKFSENQKFEQQSNEAEAELQKILSSEVEENVNDVITEENELKKQLDHRFHKLDMLIGELSKLEEQNKDLTGKEKALDEQIASLKCEHEILMSTKKDDPQMISLHNRNIRENLQVQLTGQICSLEDQVKRVELELDCAKSEHISLMMLLGNEQRDWSKDVEILIEKEKELEEIILVERKATAALRNKRMELDMEVMTFNLEINDKIHI
ncbi:unnamed protein product [Thelazia callipaeda]|uniref:Intracellular protein transport protein USO1-like n=1 Tax=Thelazia callipaeda TaxID=103827 RepID=A0A0N5D219_THECL|nr:unnamed protein product [Thelazia callipaeda]